MIPMMIMVFLPHSPEFWDCRCTLTAMIGFKAEILNLEIYGQVLVGNVNKKSVCVYLKNNETGSQYNPRGEVVSAVKISENTCQCQARRTRKDRKISKTKSSVCSVPALRKLSLNSQRTRSKIEVPVRGTISKYWECSGLWMQEYRLPSNAMVMSTGYGILTSFVLLLAFPCLPFTDVTED